MSELAALGVWAAFAAGVASFLSPCVLPLVPAYVSYVGGESCQRGQALSAGERLAVLGMSGLFVAGFSAVFLAFGASASYVGQFVLRYRFEANLAAGVIVTVFGLFMLGLWRWMPFLQRDLRLHPRLSAGNPVAAFVLGVAFAFGWTPCIGPVLGSILALSATSNSGSGTGLLSAYAFGLGVPFLAAALFVDHAARLTRRLRRLGAAVQIIGGGVMVALGAAMITDRLTAFSLWLLDSFPGLGALG